MESAAVGRGHVDAGLELGPMSWCAAVQVCRCASVSVMAVVYQYTGVPMLPLISL